MYQHQKFVKIIVKVLYKPIKINGHLIRYGGVNLSQLEVHHQLIILSILKIVQELRVVIYQVVILIIKIKIVLIVFEL